VDLPVPDTTVHKVGRGDPLAAGRRQLRMLVHCGLLPDHHMLEIGCGIGRLAYELGPYLDRGSYVGFDISERAINWLNEQYAPRLPNFTFDLVDVYNARYNQSSSARAGEVRWPYDDDRFEFACAFSIFTHLLLPEVEHYLHELRRVLRPGGRAVATFLMVTTRDPDPPVRDGRELKVIDPVTYARSKKEPERGVAFRDVAIREVIGRVGFSIETEIEGSWHGWPVGSPRIGQDVLVLRP
jgi:SAM-dependent methyltransferase